MMGLFNGAHTMKIKLTERTEHKKNMTIDCVSFGLLRESVQCFDFLLFDVVVDDRLILFYQQQ